MSTCLHCEHWIKSRVYPDKAGLWPGEVGVCTHLKLRPWLQTRASRVALYTWPGATCDDWELRRPRCGMIESEEVER